jgi:hypothetical protein
VAGVFFLAREAAKPIEFSWPRFTDDRHNPAWRVATAWGRAWHGAEGTPDPDPSDPDYRFTVIQSQMFRRLLYRAVLARDVPILLRYMIQLADSYLPTNANARVDRVMRTALRQALSSLGLLSRTEGLSASSSGSAGGVAVARAS